MQRASQCPISIQPALWICLNVSGMLGLGCFLKPKLDRSSRWVLHGFRLAIHIYNYIHMDRSWRGAPGLAAGLGQEAYIYIGLSRGTTSICVSFRLYKSGCRLSLRIRAYVIVIDGAHRVYRVSELPVSASVNEYNLYNYIHFTQTLYNHISIVRYIVRSIRCNSCGLGCFGASGCTCFGRVLLA